jgi:hypothetical protein
MKNLFLLLAFMQAFNSYAQRIIPLSQQLSKTSIAVANDSLVYIGILTGSVKVFNGTDVVDPVFTLPSNIAIRSMEHHPSGALWIGLNTGLLRVVGTTVTLFNMAQGNLPGDTVLALGVTNNGHVIAGTNAGLVVFDGSTWTTYNTANSVLLSNRITSIKTSQNRVGLVAGTSAYIYAGGNITASAFNAGAAVVSILPQSNGGSLLTTDSTVYYIGVNGTNYLLSQVLRVSDLTADNGTDKIYMMQGRRLYLFDQPTLTFRNVNIGPFMSSPAHPILIKQSATGQFFILSRLSLNILKDFNFVDESPNSFNRRNLDINQVDALYMSTGDMFWDRAGSGNARYNVPKVTNPGDTAKHTLFAASPWIGGISNGTLYQSAQTYRQSSVGGAAYRPGPLDANGQRLEAEGMYDRLWKINRFDIEVFKQAWLAGNVQNGNYLPPVDMREWPGNRPGGGVLAPFHDQNADGIYNYLDGDYPLIKGDQSIWGVFNDLSPNRTISTPALGLEIHVSAYAYVCNQATGQDTVLNYTTFLDYVIKNKSSRSYQDTYIAFWVDGDVGNPIDDFTGMDVAGNGFYFYNGDDVDEGLIQGYGLNPPAQGIYQLKGPLAPANDGIDNNRNGVVDEVGEDIAFSNFLYFDNNGLPNGNPTEGTHFYNYSRALWKDNSQVVFGGTGYPGSGGSTLQAAKFMFPANSDPVGWGLGGTTASPVTAPFAWSETLPGIGIPPNQPADRRGVGAMGPFNLASGAEQSFTMALIYSRGSSGAQSSVTRLLSHDAPRIKQWFAQGNFPSCLDLSTVSVQELGVEAAQVRIYPNPVQNELMVEIAETAPVRLELYDVQGRLLQQQQLAGSQTHAMDVQQLSPGMYVLHIRQGNKLKQHKFMKQ